jgi:hypothetical protein
MERQKWRRLAGTERTGTVCWKVGRSENHWAALLTCTIVIGLIGPLQNLAQNVSDGFFTLHAGILTPCRSHLR